ncbi:ribonuclease III [Candidatus Roizmanbacteria bacterium RIFCSPHIGHO2_02_FULL_37_13b]|uniref:Ribonuclease 3 n=1 Tax=Candidatus Roizmanbacteria bacterium RIFCSPLOWO2_02_FULL_36_11 TaxID=1802071 RepID=A0A1F7JC06_9BACT|nr:MAG: ribonuclease III [Candidatus Roizmanbacteria bacterium RIFCSPHIGHO2_02_FULL_37_13b]OGK53140.1 MAG: ribonuclease III [Candidatus Roizmanbacteria bacterium RIFCSPLOWO2_02_FULL_36_11]
MNNSQIDNIQKKIGIAIKNKSLLQTAFVHRSYLNENKSFKLPSNEKLEFLGDSVLSLITSIYLYTKYPELSEGHYTDIKASIVKTESLYEAALKLNLGKYLYLSKGEQDNNGASNTSILADTFEAVVAVIFLDQDFTSAYSFVSEHLFANKLDAIIKNNLYLSAKNKLQEYLQDKFKKLPTYKVIEQKGPEHNKIYNVGVFFENKLIAKGTGHSKKHAQDDAASQALQTLKI